jgi:hypothetical protein
MRSTRAASPVASAAATLLLSTSVVIGKAAEPEGAPNHEIFLKGPPRLATMQGRSTIVSLGDLRFTAPQIDNDGSDMQKKLEIARARDVAIANQVGMQFDRKNPMVSTFDPRPVYGQPTLARDHKAMGVDIVSAANQHGMTWPAKTRSRA